MANGKWAVVRVKIRQESAHDREDRQQTDGARGPLSRSNHGCDLLADDVVDLVANSSYYSGTQRQELGLPYWTVSGNPLAGDPFQLVGAHCVKVRLSHVLRHHMAQGALPKCLRVMHLAWEGHILLDSLTAIWEQLPEFLLAELLRGFLGRMCSSRNNLLGYLSCADAKVIREVVSSAKVADTCLHCGTSRESRTHVRYECPHWRRYTRQISLTMARHLAPWGDSFWFDPASRCQPMPLDDNGHHVRDIWGFKSSTPLTGPNLCVMHAYPNRV